MFVKTIDKNECSVYTNHCQVNTKDLPHHTNGVGAPLIRQAFCYIHTNSHPERIRIWTQQKRYVKLLLHIFFELSSNFRRFSKISQGKRIKENVANCKRVLLYLNFEYKRGDIIGFIYQIRNIVNDKKYIGMTTRNVEIRKLDHIKTYNDTKSRMYNFKLYRAMRKYGCDKFEFSVIEECSNDKLEEKERYYIKLYNTTANGYNEALGGSGKLLWTDKQVEACKILYENGWLLQDISDVFKSNPRTVGEKLRQYYDINTRENSISNISKVVVGINKNKEVIEFPSLSDAARYLLDNNLTQNKNIPSVISKISISLHNVNRTAYGYKWTYKVA